MGQNIVKSNKQVINYTQKDYPFFTHNTTNNTFTYYKNADESIQFIIIDTDINMIEKIKSNNNKLNIKTIIKYLEGNASKKNINEVYNIKIYEEYSHIDMDILSNGYQ